MEQLTRRDLLKSTAFAGAAVAASSMPVVLAHAQQPAEGSRIRLGMVTYNMGKDMTLAQLFDLCQKTRLEGLELRTTHAHGVEVALSADQRREVKARFADSPVELVGLGSAFEFQSTDPAEVRSNVEGAKEYAQLAADVGAAGIKVRPNGLPEGVPAEQTCAQIGKALREVAESAATVGVQVRLEVHGRGTSEPRWCHRIMQAADHPNAVVCWNSNATDMSPDGSIDAAWELLRPYVKIVHINEIGRPIYPWQDLFDKLTAGNYDGFCLAEIQFNPEPERFMRYYRTLFDFYTQGES